MPTADQFSQSVVQSVVTREAHSRDSWRHGGTVGGTAGGLAAQLAAQSGGMAAKLAAQPPLAARRHSRGGMAAKLPLAAGRHSLAGRRWRVEFSAQAGRTALCTATGPACSQPAVIPETCEV